MPREESPAAVPDELPELPDAAFERLDPPPGPPPLFETLGSEVEPVRRILERRTDSKLPDNLRRAEDLKDRLDQAQKSAATQETQKVTPEQDQVEEGREAVIEKSHEIKEAPSTPVPTATQAMDDEIQANLDQATEVAAADDQPSEPAAVADKPSGAGTLDKAKLFLKANPLYKQGIVGGLGIGLVVLVVLVLGIILF